MLQKKLHYSLLETPLDTLIAVADDQFLYALEFVEKENLTTEIPRIEKKLNAGISSGMTSILKNIGSEMTDYLAGKITEFNTPIQMTGSSFQIKVWKELKKIPAGKTRSYLDIAKAIGQPKACRAVGNANGCNPLVIIVPCHRVINHNGMMGGYGGGIHRKEWLLAHENRQG